jgi:YVTN family beta-propeller protein
MGIANNKGFIIINGSNLVKIVNLNNFKQVAELTVNYPRYFLQVDSNKAYITNGSFAGYIQIVNLSNSTITDSIPVGNGPENLLKTDKYVYVANSGGWINDSTVSVIDVNTDKEIAKIVVGENPCDLVIDAESNIWVICKGYYDTNYLRGESKIVKINHSTNQVEKSFKVGVAHDNFESKLLAISDDLKTIYYQEIGGVYSLPVNASQLSAEPVIRTQIALYGLEVNPHNGDIYCFDPGDFTSAGKVTIYDKNGTKKHEVVAGIGPNGAVFN